MKTSVETEGGVGTSKQILVVEDEPAIQDVLQFALKGAGYEVLLAHDGREALEHMQTVIPDLILLDLVMPGMNGHCFIKELDRCGMRSTIPIIVLSAFASVEDLKQMHVCAYLPKPFSMKTLLEKVHHCVRSPLPHKPDGSELSPDLQFKDKLIEIEQIAPGTTMNVNFTFSPTAAGRYEIACQMRGHYLAGMRLPIRVTE